MPTIEELRLQIDRIDDKLVQLLIDRLGLVSQVGKIRADAGENIIYVPAREAEIIRRLAARVGDAMPLGAMVRMWRELLGAAVKLEGNFVVGVYEPQDNEPRLHELARDLRELARDHFGSQADLRPHASTGMIQAVTGGSIAVGVLPLPWVDGVEPWWRHLLYRRENTPRVIARLPFGPSGNARGEGALVIGYGEQRQTKNARGQELPENDCTLFAIERDDPISPDKLVSSLTAVGLSRTFRVSSERSNGEPQITLVGLEGYVSTNDKKLDRLCEQLGIERSRLMYVGGYAEPLSQAGQDGASAG